MPTRNSSPVSNSRAIDQESRRLIREELLTNILVEAGAGSGKTEMLAERMASGVAAGLYLVEHLAAVTFTRKAASELRGRFHLALERELAKARDESRPDYSPDPERVARLVSALSNLERFFAGTIHSFCARLLRERRQIQAGRQVPAREFARALTPDLESSYLGAAGRSRLLRAALRAYWSAVLALLPG